MPSVNPIQAPEPRVQPASKQQSPNGDPFADMLESAANKRPTREETRAERSTKREQPTAPASRGKNRAEALDRGDQPKGEASRTARGKTKSVDEPAKPDTAETQDARPEQASGTDASPQASEVVTDAPAIITAETSVEAPVVVEKPATEVVAVAGAEPVTPNLAPAVAEPDASMQTAEAAKPSAPAASAVPEPANADQVSLEAPVVAAPKAAAAAAPQAPADDDSGDAVKTAPAASSMRAAAPPTGQEQPQQTAPANQHAASFSDVMDAVSSDADQPAQQQGASPQVQAKTQDVSPARLSETSNAAPAPVDSAGPKVQPNPAQTAPMPEPVRALNASFDSAILNASSTKDWKPLPLNASAIAVEIVSRLREGSRRFDIRLDPPELGRIDVRLEVDRNGNVSTKLTVDRPETLDLVQREARGLERALQQAGLKTDAGGLEFSLRQHADERFAPGQEQSGRGAFQSERAASDGAEPSESIVQGYYRAAAFARGGVDISV